MAMWQQLSDASAVGKLQTAGMFYGAAPETQIEWPRHPELMRQAKERKAPSRPAVKGATLVKSAPSSR
jgi:hypothetical protein